MDNFHNFPLLNSERTAEEAGIEATTSPQICCRTTLRKVNDKLYIFTAQWCKKVKKVKEADLYSASIEVPYTQGAQVRITQWYLQTTPYLPLRLITINVHEGCYFRVCLCILSARIHALSSARRCMVNGCVDCALFNVVPNVYLRNWKAWLTEQTKYLNDFIMTSETGRKNTS